MGPERLQAGIEHFERWQATRSPADLASAIADLSALDADLPAVHDLRLPVDLVLMLALDARYQLTDSMDDLDGVIERLRRIVAVPDPRPEFAAYRVALGRALYNRINMYGQPGGPPPIPDAEFLEELRTAVDGLAVAQRADVNLVPAGERAQAAAMRAHLIPKLVLTQAIVDRKAKKPVDPGEIERVLRDLPADHPNRAQLILEAGIAHMAQVLLAPGRGGSFTTSEHRVPAARYLSQAVELLNPDYPERPKALAFLSFLAFTRRPDSPDATAAGPVQQLVSEAIGATGLDQVLGAVLRLMAGTSVNPGSSAADVEQAVARLNEAMDLAGDPRVSEAAPEIAKALPSAILGVFRGLLSTPYMSSPSLDDQDAADAYGRRLLAGQQDLPGQVAAGYPPLAPIAQLGHPAFRSARAASDRLHDAFRRGDLAGVDGALAELERLLAELPADNEFRWGLVLLLGSGQRVRGALTGSADEAAHGLRTLVTAFDQAAASPLSKLADGGERTARQRGAALTAELGQLTRDPEVLTDAIRRMTALRDAPDLTRAERADLSWQHGMALAWRYGLTREQRDLDEGITRLEQAVQVAGEDAGHRLLRDLSQARWTRGDRGQLDQERAIALGLRALRQRAADVLLQSGAAQGLRLARSGGFARFAPLIGWCLAESRPDQAIEALERGRALVLHAATSSADIPGLLRAAGQDGLAGEWQAEAARGGISTEDLPFPLPGPGSAAPAPDAGPRLRVPSRLRRQVLGALRATPAGQQLLAASGLPELAGTLHRANADAFVYLLPPLAGHDGRALLLRGPDGLVEQLTLPGLGDTGPLDAYDAALRGAATGDPADLDAWLEALEALCDWSWTAAVGPLLDQVGRWPLSGLPRLVVIPAGRLALVPWHAARTAGPAGRWHYAVQDAVFSYAATAGQFARAADRPARAIAAAPLLVANPTGDPELALAQLEVAELLRRFYPGADYLGRPAALATGAGTPAEVLSQLTGGSGPPASLLHCGCHATAADSLTESHLLLSGEARLQVADILSQAQRHDPGNPGFLAVLSACMTDLANKDHDEALTLASALLAAGASGVVGARWPVPDNATAPLMLMFHHFLNNGHPDPADALRQAQLWMLSDDRPVLAGLPDGLDYAARLGILARPYCWAAFTCQGAHARA